MIAQQSHSEVESTGAAILNWEAEGDIFPFSFFLLAQEVSRRNTRSRA
jgi:hypothetical protein